MEFVERYRRRLVTFVYNDRVLISGSSLEIPAAYFLANPTDVDFMFYRIHVCAIPRHALPPRNFRNAHEILKIEPQGLATGYVRLRNSTQEFERHLRTFSYDHPHGPAITNATGWSTVTFDNVFSVQCPYWPPEAEEWKKRHRPHGWPSKELIDQIVSEGCFLVGKSHPNFNDDNKTQWRYSFSMAEVRLVSSWTDFQKYVYHVLRLMKTEFLKESDNMKKHGLCTYHLKTQMFWACEEQPAEFWNESNLLDCICELLTNMEQRLSAGHFPNYFLRDCNIREGSSTENGLKMAIRMLNTDLGRLILKSNLPPKVCPECCSAVSFPVELALFCHLFARRFNITLQTHRSRLHKLQSLIDEDINDIMTAILNCKLAKSPGDSYYAAAEHHLWNSISRRDPIDLMATQKRVTISHDISTNAVSAGFESLEDGQLLTTRVQTSHTCKWDISAVIGCTKDQCPYAGKSWNFPWNEAHGQFNEKWLTPSHFLSSAFLANVYFRTGHLVTCIEFATEKHYLACKAFNTELFPMIFSPEMASLFDENIQAVLGLLWLCDHLWVSDLKKNFEFCSCPQLFLLYILIQCYLRRDDLEKAKSGINSFFQHRDNCKFRFHLYTYHYVLLQMAWNIHVKQLRLSTLEGFDEPWQNRLFNDFL